MQNSRIFACGDGTKLDAGADYNIAMAYNLVGRALFAGGAAGPALGFFAEARQRFDDLGDRGERMSSVCLARQGNCLLELGRPDEAAAMYEDGIRQDEDHRRERDVAVGKGNLGTVRLMQRRYAEALETFEEARATFERLGEPAAVATAWHQIGNVNQEAGRFSDAEQAYRRSLQIKVTMDDRSGQASTLGQLGNLYSGAGKLDQSVPFYRQAADLYAGLGNARMEGRARNNLGDELVTLGRYDEARREILRAIECNESFGHAATPWTTWNILCNLERAVGDAAAAGDARRKAIEAFLAYRRDGGENLTGTPTADWCAGVRQAIVVGAQGEVMAQLDALAAQELPPYLQVVVPKLRAIVSGSRDPSIADDASLDYDDAAELLLLLEQLGT
ncbi:MAG: tetratricopeptide repeat protein [Capsulimonadaceae bacterium]